MAIAMKDSQIVTVPNNEGRVCDAVVRALEKWTRKTRTDVRHPDKEGDGPPVDLRLKLGTQDYAIEHTRIESFGNQIGTVAVANQIVRHVRKNIPDAFPGPAYYELQFRTDVSLPEGRDRRARALNSLVQWIRTSERILRDRNPVPVPPVRNPHLANDWIRGNAHRIRLRLPTVALAGRAAHPAGTGRTQVPVHPSGRSGWPASGQPAADILQEMSQASGLQGGRGANGAGAGKRRFGPRALRIQG